MKWTHLVATSATSLTLALSAGAAQPRAVIEKSPDVLAPAKLERSAAKRVAPLVLAPELLALAAVTPADVGDADSFARYVTYLGTAQTLGVTVLDDCSASDPAVERCVPASPTPGVTSWNEADLATVNLPARSTKSLICFALTPFINLSWQNFTATQQTARFSARATIVIENDVLADPALMDPGTGLPFGGELTLSLSTWHKFKSIEPGQFEDENSTQSRNCIAGLVSKRNLVEGYGLSEAQATQFFRRPMTIRFGASGSVSMQQYASYFYGIRLYGD